jgi:hypothetical protein
MGSATPPHPLSPQNTTKDRAPTTTRKRAHAHMEAVLGIGSGALCG